MSYFPSYIYSTSAGWTFDIQPESSHSDSSGLYPGYYSTASSTNYGEVPISKYSELAGALGPVVSNTQDNGIQPFSPASQPIPPPVHQLAPQPIPQPVPQPSVQPVLSQPAGLALSQLTPPIFTQLAQLTQPVNPLPVTLTHLGVQAQNQNAAPPPAATTRRQAYVFNSPPKRRPRQPPNTPIFCKVNGCQRWTRKRGKKLARHRASHFSGKVGVTCPCCQLIFSQSARCHDHLKDKHPQYWAYIAATKGTQDVWGIKIGPEMINGSLVEDAEYTPWAEYEL